MLGKSERGDFYLLARNNVPHVHGTWKYVSSSSAEIYEEFLSFQSGRSRKMDSNSRSISISIEHTTQYIGSPLFMIDVWYVTIDFFEKTIIA